MKKIRHDKAFILEHEGYKWTMDLAEWFDPDTSHGELRCYRIEGDINGPYREALELEAATRGLVAVLAQAKGA